MDELEFSFDDDVEALPTPTPSARPGRGRTQAPVPRRPDSSDASMPNLGARPQVEAFVHDMPPQTVQPPPTTGIRMGPPTSVPAKTTPPAKKARTLGPANPVGGTSGAPSAGRGEQGPRVGSVGDGVELHAHADGSPGTPSPISGEQAPSVDPNPDSTLRCGVCARSPAEGTEWPATVFVSGSQVEIKDACMRCLRTVTELFPHMSWPLAAALAAAAP